MKREYEDILYNLDDDNFSSRFVREKNNLKTAITQTEKEIKLQASAIDENTSAISSLSITAENITSRVEQTEMDLVSYAEMALTSDEVYSIVSTEYIKGRVDGEYATSDDIYTLQASIEQNAESITMIVSDSGSGEESIFKQTADGGFEMSGDVKITGVDSDLYLGKDVNEQKSIIMSDSAKILTVSDGIGGYSAFSISGVRVDFVGLGNVNDDYDSPNIKANGMILATQDWVLANSGAGGTVVAVFG
jgi:hypothetical protein